MELAEIQLLIKSLDELLKQQGESGLEGREKSLLAAVLVGKTYEEMRQITGNPLSYYETDYLAKSVAFPLRKRVKKVMEALGIISAGEKITNKNILEYLNRVHAFMNAPTESSSLASPAVPRVEPLELDEELSYWVGRSATLAECKEKLLQDCRILEILGITGIGKTILSQRLLLESELKSYFKEIIFLSFESPQSAFDVLTDKLLGESIVGNEQIHQNPERLIDHLRMQMQSYPYLLVLDMVEEQLETLSASQTQFKDARFTQLLEAVAGIFKMPSRIIITSQIMLPVLNEGRYPARIHSINLPGLSETESLELFQKRGLIPASEQGLDYLQRIIRAHDGHPLTLRAIAGEILQPPYSGSVIAYWNDYGTEIEAEERGINKDARGISRLDCYSLSLTDSVKTRIEKTFYRLRESDLLAAYLLAMGAAYEEPVKRSGWLAMLDEYPLQEATLAFQTLQRRFLLNTSLKDEQVLYSVHPLIRRVALEHLDEIEEVL